jgi:hypothetical protein
MAFSKTISSRLEQLTTSQGSGVNKIENYALAVTIALQETLGIIEEASLRWDNGVGDIVESTPFSTYPPGDSQFSQRQWMMWLAAKAAIVTLFEIPLASLSALAVTDGSGNIVLDAENNPIMPFNSGVDPVVLKIVGSHDSVKTIIWSDPIIGVIPDVSITQPERTRSVD